MLLRPLTAVALAALLMIASTAQADELQNRLVAAQRAARADSYRFRRTILIDRTGAARKTLVEQFDPRQPAPQQWQLVSVDGHAPTAKEADQSRKAKRGPVPSYAELAPWFGAPAVRSEPAPGYVSYRFAHLPAGSFKIGSHDASADTQAEALVNIKGAVPFVERIRLSSTKGFRMMLVASVTSMVINQSYRLLPDGHVVPNGSASDISGALFGKAGQLRSSATYADIEAVR